MDGGALKRAREELGITRDQLYAYSGVSRETQRKMEETGYIPKQSTIVALERGLRLAAEEVGVMQRLKSLEDQVQTLESLVRMLIVGRTAQPAGVQDPQ